MSVLKYDKVILKKEFKNLKMVGEVYEVANITDTSIVLRDSKTKVAVGVIDFDDFEEYFGKPSEMREWTAWTMFQSEGDAVGFYRTNGKKVEVKWNGFKSAAYCCSLDDFNLFFGIKLAYKRCIIKYLLKLKKEHEAILKVVNGEIKDNEKIIKDMIDILNEKYKKEHE